MHAEIAPPPPPVNRMTDTCKNITFATSLRTVINVLKVAKVHLLPGTSCFKSTVITLLAKKPVIGDQSHLSQQVTLPKRNLVPMVSFMLHETFTHDQFIKVRNNNTVRERLIRSHSSARFCFELSGNSN